MLSDCTCPGHELQLRCTAGQAGFTLWRVNNCTITLRHSNQGGDTGYCDERSIVGQLIEKDEQNVTSQLTITSVNTSLTGMHVECIYDDGLTQSVIGKHTITFLSGTNTLGNFIKSNLLLYFILI